MSFEYLKHLRKVNLGCGFDKKQGFLNIDINTSHNPDLVCDVTSLEILPSGYYEYAIAQDVLEHIKRLRIENTLKEWNRILKVGGILELRVPNAVALLTMLTREENRSPAMQEKLLQCLFGTQVYDGDFHYYSFTEVLIRTLLENTGFTVERIAVKDEWLFDIRARKTSDSPIDELFSLDDEDFVIQVFRRLLGRSPDEGGLRHYVGMLKDGSIREAIVESIKNSEEYRIKHNSAGA